MGEGGAVRIDERVPMRACARIGKPVKVMRPARMDGRPRGCLQDVDDQAGDHEHAERHAQQPGDQVLAHFDAPR
ncbi:hypothetical protein Bsp3421_003983 [Burkholderia sp. FERM BP-3421]|uniref:hypothetical protein n=1 Tax=Burkholderia sp. FERM BP-3421 TaxID=1494466 RepID=UPI00235EC560|nr:hypothetical protein [Burkholderia sp. FERM BP-3421]WDD93882.1 hypothetical protein Bsp3421_003983 [Burkholderia sp. FERM BP-3421]